MELSGSVKRSNPTSHNSIILPWCLCVWTLSKTSGLAKLALIVLIIVLVSTIIANIYFIFNLETSSQFYVFRNSLNGLQGKRKGDESKHQREELVGLPQGKSIEIAAYSSSKHVYVSVDGIKVLDEKSSSTRARGIYIIVLNEATGATMASESFDTFGVGESGHLVQFLNMVSDGRILIFTVLDEASANLENQARKLLEQFGSKYAQKIEWRDSWAFIAVKNGAVYDEVHNHNPIVSQWGQPVLARANFALDMSAITRCSWHGESEEISRRRKNFCERFEGYGKVCHCTNPAPIDINPSQQPTGIKVENIPVAIVAANRPRYLFRALQSMLSADGAKRELFTIFVDGFYKEPVAVANLFDVRVVQHVPISKRNARISQHYKRTLMETFNMNPEAKYMIILEEDLEVSVDIFTYFSQLLPLMDKDESLFCVSAWNDHGFNHSCKDPSMLYRVEGMPGLGWLLRRSIFEEELEKKWPSPDKFWDWDVWMRMEENRKGRDCIIPDVPRTYHFGWRGLNMYLIFQRLYFFEHSLNKKRNVAFDVDTMEKKEYRKEVARLIKNAELLDHSKNPCSSDFIPDTSGKTYVLYMEMKNSTDWETWLNIAKCFKIWDWDSRGYYKSTWRLWLKGNHIVIVGTPASTFANLKPAGVKPIYIQKRKQSRVHDVVERDNIELQKKIHKVLK